MKEVYLVGQSGGLDSTYLLYNLLKNTSKDIHIHVHKIIFKNREYRQEAENISIAKNYELLQDIREFTFTKSTIDTLEIGYIIKDLTQILVTMFNVAVSLKKYGNSIKFFYGLIYNDHNTIDRRKMLQKYLTEKSKVVSSEIELPILSMKKVKLYYGLPEEIRKNIWSCRKPIKTKKGYHYCGRCITCKEYIRYRLPVQTNFNQDKK